MTKEQQRFYDVKHYSDYTTVGGNIDFAIIIDDSEKKVILQFEESENFDPHKKDFFHQDWVENFLFIPWLVKLDNKHIWTTLGYAMGYKSTQDIPINAWFKECLKRPDYMRVIQGYSFGSAMAKLSAIHHKIRTGEKVAELWTWGDVKCLLNPFKKWQNYAEKCQCYACPNDGVTRCVPFFSRFWNSKRKVGPSFNLFKMLFHTSDYHADYDLYDYSKYEK